LFFVFFNNHICVPPEGDVSQTIERPYLFFRNLVDFCRTRSKKMRSLVSKTIPRVTRKTDWHLYQLYFSLWRSNLEKSAQSLILPPKTWGGYAPGFLVGTSGKVPESLINSHYINEPSPSPQPFSCCLSPTPQQDESLCCASPGQFGKDVLSHLR